MYICLVCSVGAIIRARAGISSFHLLLEGISKVLMSSLSESLGLSLWCWGSNFLWLDSSLGWNWGSWFSWSGNFRFFCWSCSSWLGSLFNWSSGSWSCSSLNNSVPLVLLRSSSGVDVSLEGLGSWSGWKSITSVESSLSELLNLIVFRWLILGADSNSWMSNWSDISVTLSLLSWVINLLASLKCKLLFLLEIILVVTWLDTVLLHAFQNLISSSPCHFAHCTFSSFVVVSTLESISSFLSDLKGSCSIVVEVVCLWVIFNLRSAYECRKWSQNVEQFHFYL